MPEHKRTPPLKTKASEASLHYDGYDMSSTFRRYGGRGKTLGEMQKRMRDRTPFEKRRDAHGSIDSDIHLPSRPKPKRAARGKREAPRRA